MYPLEFQPEVMHIILRQLTVDVDDRMSRDLRVSAEEIKIFDR